MRSVSRAHKGAPHREPEGHYGGEGIQRRAVGYVRVSTDMQATEGMSLDAQQSAIEGYCALHGIKLVKICKDVISGGKDVRPGLQEALRTLQTSADVLIVLKFDRLSRSIKHFCELYETYFKDGTKELVAIRESIRLDSSLGRALVGILLVFAQMEREATGERSSLGRALVGILLVFAQMEREATGERTREAINHIKKSGYHFGKVPFGKRTIPAPDHPRMKILVDDEKELAVIAQLREWATEGVGISEMAERLNAKGTKPPQGATWTKSLLYNLRLRLSHIIPKPHNERPYGDNEVKERILELRANGHSLRQIAAILNEQGWLPLKARRFSVENIHGLLARTSAAKPRGHEHWWPAQVQQVLEGRFEGYYGTQTVEAEPIEQTDT